MNHNFTTDHLLLYLYDELPLQERNALEAILPADDLLSSQLEEMKETLLEMDKAALDPHDTSVQIILEHSLDTHFAH